METLVERTPPTAEDNHFAHQIAGTLAPPDAKQLRVEHVGKLLEKAYARASTLKLKKEEWEQLRADFPDEAIEERTIQGKTLHYIGHMELRERLWSVFHPGEIIEIPRNSFIRSDTNEMLVDLVLVARGCVLAEAHGSARYFQNNPNGSYRDCHESAWSEALRGCCKHFGVGTQVWRASWLREFTDKQATKRQESRELKAEPEKKVWTRKTHIKGETAKRETATPETDEDDKIPF